jgi:hypothetical protein
LLGSFFDPEEGRDWFFRNIGLVHTEYPMLYHRR